MSSLTTVLAIMVALEHLYIMSLSPLIVMPLSKVLFHPDDITSPYKIAILLCLLFLVQVWSTRHFQSLPPERVKR